MAKDKAKKAKMKVPKTVAGVKVPKKVRKAVKPIVEAAGNPIVAEVAAAALVAAAGALAARKIKGADKAASPHRFAGAGGSLKDAFTSLANEMAGKALTALEALEQNIGRKDEGHDRPPKAAQSAD